MKSLSFLPGDIIAEHIVEHFQKEGFSGITEAMIIRVGLKQGSRGEVDAAFEEALESDRMLPVHEHFDLHPFGHYAESRSFEEARSAIQSDFGISLRVDLPRLFFEPAPIIIDDALATGTRYDAMIKLCDNIDGFAYAILLNDPDSSFIEYLGTHHGKDWDKLLDGITTTAIALAPEFTLN
ncbi:MAG: hypothetical protein EKK46_00565 [Rhodocyclaceae bacterium]|nr:MAG: hypothetical protein EKK46_00565 [Rhodocyclaceae bacterium]